MQFDAPTALIAICTLMSVLGLQFLVFWSRDRRAPWLAWFGCTFLLCAASALIYLLPHRGNEFLVLGGGNALRLAACAFLWQDARVFSGRRPDLLLPAFVLAVWLALCSIPAFVASMELRVITSAALVALFLGLGAWELWRGREERLPSRGLAIMVYSSFALISAARIPLVNLVPFPVGALPATPGWIAGFGLIIFIHASLLVGCMIAMTRERRELEQRQVSLVDPLTGLFNRRAFIEEAERHAGRRKGGREPLAALVLDLDLFKSINDRFGHETGDQVLQHFGAVARHATRATDMLFRMGGEEFCFVLPTTGGPEALIVAERIRTRFSENPIEINGEPIRATVSIGIAMGEFAGFDLELLRAAADAAVYEAKSRGRNCTVVAGPEALRRPGPIGKSAVA